VAVERVGLDGSRKVIVPQTGEEFALSPDGRRIAYQLTKYRVGIGVAEVGTRAKVYELGKLVPKASWGLTGFGGLTWSPDGREIAFYLSAGEGEILRSMRWRPQQGRPRMLAEIAGAAFADLAWNPDN
jgi:Tol biopolymer transport system component